MLLTYPQWERTQYREGRYSVVASVRYAGRLSVMLLNITEIKFFSWIISALYGTGKSLARPGRKQATATEDFDVHISYL